MQKLLRKIVHVEPEELPALGWSFAYFFFLLAGYYVLRPVRDEMGIRSGVQNLPALMSATFLTMLAIAPIFGWLASRLERRRMLPAVYFFFIFNLGLFWLAMKEGVDPGWVARIFYVWLSVFNLFVVSVFWSFMADLFTNAQAKRLFGVIAAGGSTGALLGPTLTTLFVGSVGTHGLMLIAAGFLFVCVACIHRLDRWSAIRTDGAQRRDVQAAEAAIGGSVWAGLRLAATSPYLAAICLYIFLLTWTSVLLYLEQSRIIAAEFSSSVERTRYFAHVDLIVNALTLACQLFLTNRVIERLGLAAALVFLPAISVIGFFGMAGTPLLTTLVAFAVARRVGEYAIAKPAREVLFTVVDRESKYKAKNFIDTAVTRGGEAASGWLVNGIKALGATAAQLAAVAIPISIGWAVLGWVLARQHDRIKAGSEPSEPAARVAASS